MASKSALVGISGVYYVAADLSQLGYIATVTSRNAQGVDIFVSSSDGLKSVSIQVKTSGAEQRKRFTRSWRMDKKHENLYSDSFFYVFVDLHEGNSKPDYYVVPSKVVAEYVRTSHAKWLQTPSKSGKIHEDHPHRLYEIYDDKIAEKYKDAWHLLGL